MEGGAGAGRRVEVGDGTEVVALGRWSLVSGLCPLNLDGLQLESHAHRESLLRSTRPCSIYSRDRREGIEGIVRCRPMHALRCGLQMQIR